MKIAVVQHAIGATPADDVDGLVSAADTAASGGAEFVVLPEVGSLGGEENSDRDLLFLQLDAIPGKRLIPQIPETMNEYLGFATAPEGLESMGTMALLVGDACFDSAQLIPLFDESPSLAILMPRSESDLQAEAVLEYAIGLSESLCGLVIVVEPCGAELGEPGHGGSVIVSLGRVVAEALGGAEVLLADIDMPLSSPKPREPLPVVPTILAQRVASHRGQHFDMGYPEDLSASPSER